MVCGILVPWSEIECKPLALKAWSPNHWMAVEVPQGIFIFVNVNNGHQTSIKKFSEQSSLCASLRVGSREKFFQWHVFHEYLVYNKPHGSFIVCVCAQLVPCVWLFATPWTIAHQTLLSMVFSRQEYWSGLPFPTLGYLPNLGIKPMSSVSPTVSGRFSTTVPPGKPVASSCLVYSDLLLCSLVVHHGSDHLDGGSKIVSILVGKGQLVCI